MQELIHKIIHTLTDRDAWLEFLPEPRSAATAQAVVASTGGESGRIDGGAASAVPAHQPGQRQEKPTLGKRKLSVAYLALILFELQESHPDAVSILCLLTLGGSLLMVLCLLALTDGDDRW